MVVSLKGDKEFEKLLSTKDKALRIILMITSMAPFPKLVQVKKLLVIFLGLEGHLEQ